MFPFHEYLDQDFDMGATALAEFVIRVAPSPATLLDIGAGPMDTTAVFARLGYECFAVDDLGDPWHGLGDNVARIQEYAKSQGICFYRQSAPSYEIPFEIGSFDVVMLNSVIEHLHESPRDLLTTAFRYAKVGGVVVVTMPNAVNLRKRLSVLCGRTNYPPVEGFFHSVGGWRGHVREFTLDETRYILEQAGGGTILATTFHAVLSARIGNPLARMAFIALTRRFPTLRSHIVVVSRKDDDWRPAEWSESGYWDAIRKSVPKGVLPI